MDSYVRIHKFAKFRKLTPLDVDFDVSGKVRVRRWKQSRDWKPNGIAVEDLPGGCLAVVDFVEGLSEVRVSKVEQESNYGRHPD
jgi:hypothetical protein